MAHSLQVQIEIMSDMLDKKINETVRQQLNSQEEEHE
jgi:hypothetical protein